MLHLGRVKALPVVVAEYVGVVAAGILAKPVASAVGVVLLVLLTLYCFARPSGGWSVWGAAAAPAAVGSIASTCGGPRWVGLFVIPITLVMLWALDQDVLEDGPEARGIDPAPGQPG